MSYHDIGEGIYNLLDEVTELAHIYNYEPNELRDFPCATITALQHTNTFADTASNNREFQFMVRLYFRRDQSDYEDIMRKLVDLIIVAIEADPTLDGNCNYAIPTEARWLYQEKEVPVRICEMTITANVRLNR